MTRLIATFLVLPVLLPVLALADVGPPAHLQITEREPGLYTVQWRVPKVLPPRAVPMPELPETCEPVGERTVQSQPGAWLLTRDWQCETCIAGQVVGMRYPFPDLALTTVMRVDLLSGDRFAHVLTAGEETWLLPEGTAARDWLADARRAALAGISHALGSWVHLVFFVVLALLGGNRDVLRLVTAFTVGQIAGVLVAGFTPGIGGTPAEIGFAVGVAILARQALEPDVLRRRLLALPAVAGLAHGLGLAALLADDLGEASSELFSQLCAAVGMDAVHLVGGLVFASLVELIVRRSTFLALRRAIAYGAGALGIALAIGLAVEGVVTEAGAVASSIQVDGAPRSSTSGVAGSQRVAPAAPDAPVQSFVTVEPFEVRHEVMLRLAGLADRFDLDVESILDPADQPELQRRIATWVLESTMIEIDANVIEALLRRADFMSVDPTGALPRPNPVPEPVSEAVIGVVVAYPTLDVPQTVSLRWDALPGSVPTTVIDPESVTSQLLSVDSPTIEWTNELVEDPVPTVAAIEVEPTRLPLPWLSLPLLVASAALVMIGMRGRRRTLAFAAARIALALALLVGPLVQSAVALPASAGREPSERQARRILAGLLPNIYRAIEFRDEATIYDRLAVSVTGETLTEVYLGQRRALEIEERGGAQARVEAVEILEAAGIESRDGGFGVRAAWTVGGMVTHFGHRHFRQNRYNAVIEIAPVDGTWKIRSIDVLEQERIR